MYYTIDKENDYSKSSDAIIVNLADNGSILIKQNYYEIIIDKEQLDAFNLIYKSLYQEFCERFDEFVDDKPQQKTRNELDREPSLEDENCYINKADPIDDEILL